MEGGSHLPEALRLLRTSTVGGRLNFLHSRALKARKTAVHCGVLLRQSPTAGHRKEYLTSWRSPEAFGDVESVMKSAEVHVRPGHLSSSVS